MKKALFMMSIVLIACVSMTVTSCSNEEDFPTDDIRISKEQPKIKVVRVVNGKIMKNTRSIMEEDEGNLALAFDSEEDYLAFKEELEEMEEEEIEELIENTGIQTLHTIAEQADEELEEIGELAQSEEEFRALYEEYLQKYSDKLAVNDLDNEDLELYVPDGDNPNTYIANENGDIVIGGEVVNFDFGNELTEEQKRNLNPSTYMPINPTNYHTNISEWSPKPKKKLKFYARIIGNELFIDFTARKKMWYGWKNDPHRSYYFDAVNLQPFLYLYRDSRGREYLFHPPLYIFEGKRFKKGVTRCYLGKTLFGVLTGQFKIWTDMSAEYDNKGKMIMEIKGGMTVPKLLDSKAHIVDIMLY